MAATTQSSEQSSRPETHEEIAGELLDDDMVREYFIRDPQSNGFIIPVADVKGEPGRYLNMCELIGSEEATSQSIKSLDFLSFIKAKRIALKAIEVGKETVDLHKVRAGYERRTIERVIDPNLSKSEQLSAMRNLAKIYKLAYVKQRDDPESSLSRIGYYGKMAEYFYRFTLLEIPAGERRAGKNEKPLELSRKIYPLENEPLPQTLEDVIAYQKEKVAQASSVEESLSERVQLSLLQSIFEEEVASYQNDKTLSLEAAKITVGGIIVQDIPAMLSDKLAILYEQASADGLIKIGDSGYSKNEVQLAGSSMQRFVKHCVESHTQIQSVKGEIV